MAKRKKSTTRGKSSSASSGKASKKTRKTTTRKRTPSSRKKSTSSQATATAPAAQQRPVQHPQQVQQQGQLPAPALPQRGAQAPATPHPMARQPQAPQQPRQHQQRPAQQPPAQQPPAQLRVQTGVPQPPPRQGQAPQAAPPAQQPVQQQPQSPTQQPHQHQHQPHPAAPGQRPARHEPPADLPYHSSPMTASIRDFVESTPAVSAEDQPRVVRSARPARPVPLDHADPLTQAQIYETLAALFVPYARKMESEWHPKIGYCLKARNEMNGRESHFCAVQTMDEGVAYHLFPLYGHPEHLQSVSPLVASRLATPTSFFFTEINAAVVAELAHLTHLCFESFQADGQG